MEVIFVCQDGKKNGPIACTECYSTSLRIHVHVSMLDFSCMSCILFRCRSVIQLNNIMGSKSENIWNEHFEINTIAGLGNCNLHQNKPAKRHWLRASRHRALPLCHPAPRHHGLQKRTYGKNIGDMCAHVWPIDVAPFTKLKQRARKESKHPWLRAFSRRSRGFCVLE